MQGDDLLKGLCKRPSSPVGSEPYSETSSSEKCERGCTGRAVTMTHSPVSERGATFTQAMDPLIFNKRYGRRHTMRI